jgi:hypothetical protein
MAPAAVLDALLARDRAAGEIAELRRAVRLGVLEAAPWVREAQFTRISPRDVAVAFERYDCLFFGASIRTVLGDRPLRFRLSTRATSRGGSLRIAPPRQIPGGIRPESFELTVSTTLLFESFRDGERTITVAGHECADRLDALQRVIEHEAVHLVEHLRWSGTDCARKRFQAIASRLFGHTAPKHELVTPRERAMAQGFKAGQRVAFEFEGVRHEGILNRVTMRATVLVPDADGELMSDGQRYRRYYVPLRLLALA